ncbi:MAG: tetratricopeptide repeat protein [Planctomycetaceae bacterium]|nr:tetratricopeptide repeat protein [Planctomycetaceae bacterium]
MGRNLLRWASPVLVLSFSLCGCANPDTTLPTMKDSTAIPKSKVETGVKLARLQENEGRLQKALDMYDNLYKSDPKNPEICHRLMVVHSRMDHPELADQYFQQADKLRPDHADLYADYGYACYLRGDLNDAETWLQKAHQIRPKEDRITGNLALVLGAQGRVKESLTYSRQYLSDGEAHANVAYALTQRGDFTAARDHYTKALQLDPKLKSAQNALLQLAEWETAHKNKTQHAAKPESSSSDKGPTQSWQPTGSASIRS